MSTDTRSRAAWLAAGIGALLTAWVFYPGFMSIDSADQWLQARTGQFTGTHPPLMAFIWSFTDRLVPGPGGLLLIHLLLFWAALGWLGQELFARPAMQALFVLIVGLWPPVLGTMVHLWKDVPMVAFALLGVAALMRERRTPGRHWLWLALACFTLACAYRHNALPLAIPFLFVIALRWGVRGIAIRTAVALALAAVMAMLSSLPGRHPAVSPRDVWPVTALWDIAAVSIARDRMLIPADWRTPDLDVDMLRATFTPFSNTGIYDTGKLLISLYTTPTPAQRQSLREAWLGLWRDSLGEMIRHRLRLSALLLGFHRHEVPDGLRLWLQLTQLPENPVIAVEPSVTRDRIVAFLRAATQTPLFAGWVYLLAIIACALSAVRRPHQPLFWPCVASVFLFCAPLVLFAPSAEFRYLFWPVVLAPVVIALRFAARNTNANPFAFDHAVTGRRP